MKYKMTEKGFSSDFEYGTLNISSESEYGFRPFQLLVSSIAGCSGGVLRKVMKKMRLDVDHIEIEAKVTRSGGQVNIVKKMELTYVIYGRALNEEKVKKGAGCSNEKLRNGAIRQGRHSNR